MHLPFFLELYSVGSKLTQIPWAFPITDFEAMQNKDAPENKASVGEPQQQKL